MNLMRLLDFPQNIFRLMTLDNRKDAVSPGSRDGQRTSDGSEFGLIDKGWMSYIADIDSALVVSNDILRKESIKGCKRFIPPWNSPWHRNNNQQHQSS